MSHATGTAIICNMRGLHARAAAKLVKTAEAFQAEIWVSKTLDETADAANVSALSILGLMMLGADKGTSLCITVQGADAEAALKAIITLVETRFGEDD